MADTSLHKSLPVAEIHAPFGLGPYADAAARAAGADVTGADDVLKFAIQEDDNSVWMLTNHSPITWAAVGGSVSGGGLSKIFQGVDTTGGMTITNVAQVIELDYEAIKDNYYAHSTSVNPGEVEILEDGWYKITAMMTVASVSASGGIRGNPVLNIQVDTGSGFVAQPDKMGGYVREDTSNELSTSVTGVGFFEFSAGDKIRLTVYDTVDIEPDEQTLAYSQRLIVEYEDRSGSGGTTVNNLKDIGDVSAAAPRICSKLYFDENTSTWKTEELPLLGYERVICEDWAPTWAQLYAHGSAVFANTSVALNGFVGNRTVAQINALSPTANDSYVVTDAGTITLGSVVVTAGAVVFYTGTVWILVTPGVGGYVMEGVRFQLSTSTPLVAPYTDGTDDGKIVWFDGTSNTGVETSLDITLTLPDPSGLPLADGYLRRVYAGNFGGNGGHFHVDIDGSNFLDGLSRAEVTANGGAVMLGAVNGTLASVWVRISSLENHIQVRRASTWAASNFATPTAIPFLVQDLEGNDAVISWAATPNPSRLTISLTDHYHFSGVLNIDSTGGVTWNVEAWLRKNGTTEIPGTRVRTGNYGAEDQSVALPSIGLALEEGDYVEWIIEHTSLTGNLYSAMLSVSNTY